MPTPNKDTIESSVGIIVVGLAILAKGFMDGHSGLIILSGSIVWAAGFMTDYLVRRLNDAR